MKNCFSVYDDMKMTFISCRFPLQLHHTAMHSAQCTHNSSNSSHMTRACSV